MTNEERLQELDAMQKKPPVDPNQPHKLPQHVIETMARAQQKAVQKELSESPHSAEDGKEEN